MAVPEAQAPPSLDLSDDWANGLTEEWPEESEDVSLAQPEPEWATKVMKTCLSKVAVVTAQRQSMSEPAPPAPVAAPAVTAARDHSAGLSLSGLAEQSPGPTDELWAGQHAPQRAVAQFAARRQQGRAKQVGLTQLDLDELEELDAELARHTMVNCRMQPDLAAQPEDWVGVSSRSMSTLVSPSDDYRSSRPGQAGLTQRDMDKLEELDVEPARHDNDSQLDTVENPLVGCRMQSDLAELVWSLPRGQLLDLEPQAAEATERLAAEKVQREEEAARIVAEETATRLAAEEQHRAQIAAHEEAQRLEAQRLEAQRLEAQRLAAAQKAAQKAAHEEAQRLEAQRLAAAQKAAQEDAQRLEAQRLAAARQAARQEIAAHEEAQRLAAARQSARQAREEKAERRKSVRVGYHGTTRQVAEHIIRDGFRRSTGGMLGPGVYWSDDIKKTLRYPLNSYPADRVTLQLHVRPGKTKKVNLQNHPMQQTWHDHGYDTAWVPPNNTMVSSGLSEDCTWDPTRIEVVGISRDQGTTWEFVSDEARVRHRERERAQMERQQKEMERQKAETAELQSQARLLVSVKDYARAVAKFDKALSLDPHNRELQRERDEAATNEQKEIERVERARQRKAMERRKARAKILWGHAQSLTSVKDYGGAVAKFDEALSLDPGNRELQRERDEAATNQQREIERAERKERIAGCICAFALVVTFVAIVVSLLSWAFVYVDCGEGEWGVGSCECGDEFFGDRCQCTALPISSGTTISYHHGTLATYACSEGYKRSGDSSSRTCQMDGSWSGSAPTCEIPSASIRMRGVARSMRIRISGYSSRGVLEVSIDGQRWDAVCDDGFGNREAVAFCATLGFDNSVGSAYDANHGDGNFAADDIDCPRGATSVSDCSSDRHPYTDDCRGSEAVGLDCSRSREEIEEDGTSSFLGLFFWCLILCCYLAKENDK